MSFMQELIKLMKKHSVIKIESIIEFGYIDAEKESFKGINVVYDMKKLLESEVDG